MTELFIRPDVRRYLDLMAANPRPPMTDETRAIYTDSPPEVVAERVAAMDLPVGDLGEIRDAVMPGPGGDMALRMFDPRKERAPGPVVVYYHGGGWVLGSIASSAGLAAEISRQLDLPVISVEYRLAPENRWPAAPDDAEAAARWIAENGAAFGREFTGVVLCGDSAGGNLTCVTALALRDRPASVPFIAQIAIYPKTDSSRSYPSADAFRDDLVLSKDDVAYYELSYAADPMSPRYSAILGDLAGLPPTMVLTSGLDPLRDEGRAYTARLTEAGCDVIYREFTGTVHGCFTFRKLIPSAQSDLVDAMGLAKRMIASAAR